MYDVSPLLIWVVHCLILVMFQVFQVTGRVVRFSATRGENFTISLDLVAIPDRELRGALLSVEDFVRSSHSTQRSFFSELGLTRVSQSVAMADSITSCPVYAPCSPVKTVCPGHFLTDFCACWDQSSLRRRFEKDIS